MSSCLASQPKKMSDDEDDDDFGSLFEDFNETDATGVALQISANLREVVGLMGDDTVHAGDGDEGRITWEAPATHGLDNHDLPTNLRSRAREERISRELSQSFAPQALPDGPQELSEKSVAASRAILAMSDDEAKQAAELFERLAAYGKGAVVLDQQEFISLLTKLSADEKGRQLLELLLFKHKSAKSPSGVRRD